MPRSLPILRAKQSLTRVARNPTFRIDAKQADEKFLRLDQLLASHETFCLSEVLPLPFVKGAQPFYINDDEEEGVPVVSTLAVRPLAINLDLCRRIAAADFKKLSPERKLHEGDVLLTTDGGTSIGKAAVFTPSKIEEKFKEEPEVEFECTVDSHVAILRPRGISPELLAFLLASPIGQLQFQRAESGASGQTTVSESDVRRFRFPLATKEAFEHATKTLKDGLEEARRLEEQAKARRAEGWASFEATILEPSPIAKRACA